VLGVGGAAAVAEEEQRAAGAQGRGGDADHLRQRVGMARDLRRPDLMWLLFALIAVATAGALWIYDRRVIRPRAARAAAGAG